jgi:transcriptional regulator with XRE-family HTH domain
VISHDFSSFELEIDKKSQRRKDNLTKKVNTCRIALMQVKSLAPKERLPPVLEAIVADLIERRVHTNRASLAVRLEIKPAQLSRLLKGATKAGPKMLAKLCSILDQREASELLQAYLLDERDAVTRSARKKGRPIWGKDTLVTVERTSE